MEADSDDETFTTTHFLGSGSYGSVYKANGPHGVVALKKCDLFEADGVVCAGTIREWSFHASAEKFTPDLQKRLCLARQRWKTGSRAFFAMDLYDGHLMEASRKSRSLQFDDFCRIARRLGETLLLLHREGWQHRDIKPENIYLRAADSAVVIGDFNLVRFCDSEPEFVQSNHGVSTTLVCSLWTRPPELVVAEAEGVQFASCGHAVDAFSLGATLLAAATGTYMFGDKADSSLDEKLNYLTSFLTFMGTDDRIRAEKHWERAKLEEPSLPRFSSAADRIMKVLPVSWSLEEKLTVAKVLVRLLDPCPSRRAGVEAAMTLPAQADKTFSPKLKQALVRMASQLSPHHVSYEKKATAPLEVHVSCEELARRGAALLAMLGAERCPLPLAIQILRNLKFIPSNTPSSAIICGFRYLHRFALQGGPLTNTRACADILDSFVFDQSTWKKTRQLEQEPFAFSCAALWVTLRDDPWPDDFASSKDLEALLQIKGAESFFAGYGHKWKSLRKMLDSWKRLTS